MMNEFREALELVEEGYIALTSTGSTTNNKRISKTIRKALRIADKLMQEPSEGMLKKAIIPKGTYCEFPNTKRFKAMRDQMLKEIEG